MSLSPTHELVWNELSQGKSVVVRYRLAKNAEDLHKRSRPLVEALRPCGFLSESGTDIQFVNNAWLHIRRVVLLPSVLGQDLGLTTFDLSE